MKDAKSRGKRRAWSAEELAIRNRVLAGIAGSRTPGLHFPGYFLGLRWLELGLDFGRDAATMTLADGAYCRNAHGELDLAALGVLVDTVLATASRLQAQPGVRQATVNMQMQFTGHSTQGRLVARSRLEGATEGSHTHQSLASATLHADDRLVCHATGAFMLLDPPPGVTLAPLPWQRKGPGPQSPPAESELDEPERQVLARCDAALAKTSPHASFIEHFWGGLARRTKTGARLTVPVAAHLGNRVGHVQGGILFGLAAKVACVAAPHGLLSNCSAWFVSPGRPPRLTITSRVLHPGRTVAVVRTEIRGANGERVLEVISNHVARSRA